MNWFKNLFKKNKKTKKPVNQESSVTSYISIVKLNTGQIDVSLGNMSNNDDEILALLLSMQTDAVENLVLSKLSSEYVTKYLNFKQKENNMPVVSPIYAYQGVNKIK